jgi:hypothetical protein
MLTDFGSIGSGLSRTAEAIDTKPLRIISAAAITIAPRTNVTTSVSLYFMACDTAYH